MLLRGSNICTIQMSESKQAKFPVSHTLSPFKDDAFLCKANLVFPPCLFLFSQCLEMKERSQVTLRNQRPTTAGNYLEYFVPFALSTPWSAAGAVKITGCGQDSESTWTTASKAHPWAPAILYLLFSAGKNLDQRRSPQTIRLYVNEKGQFKNLLIQKEIKK